MRLSWFGVGGCFCGRLTRSSEACLSFCAINIYAFLVGSPTSYHGVKFEGRDVSIVTISVASCLRKSLRFVFEIFTVFGKI